MIPNDISTVVPPNKALTLEATDVAVNKESKISGCFTNNCQVTDLDDDDDVTIKNSKHGAKEDLIDMNLWNSALDSALEQKSSGFNAVATPSPVRKNEETVTPSPQSRAEYSGEEAEDEFSNAEDLPGNNNFLNVKNFLIYRVKRN